MDQAPTNLDQMRGPFLRVALESLKEVWPRLSRMAQALGPLLTGDAATAIGPARLVADARLRQGEKFRIRHVHDFLFCNGNVPLSLQRWAYLGLRDEVDALERLKVSRGSPRGVRDDPRSGR